MVTQFSGLVLEEMPWGENDKLITVLTAENGKVQLTLKGGSSLKNKVVGASLPMNYSEFVAADRGGRAWVREASEIEGFGNIRADLEFTSVALYFCDVASAVCVENSDESEMLQLMLNTLYALNKELKPYKQIKAAFELRVASVCGFAPDLVSCCECGKEESESMYLDVMDGIITCKDCYNKRAPLIYSNSEAWIKPVFALDKYQLDSMRYIAYSPAKKYLSFRLPKQLEDVFGQNCEKYLLSHIGRGFKTLEFLNSLNFIPKSKESERL